MRLTTFRTVHVILLFVFSISIITAQSFTRSLIHFGIEDGLPVSTVYKVIQDAEGYIWLATAGGVCQYDGYGFKCYSRENGLPDNDILNIWEDNAGRIWFNTMIWKYGYIYDDSISILELEPPFDRFQLAHIAQNKHDEYLIGTWNNGLIHLKSDTILRYFDTLSTPDRLNLVLPYDMYKDSIFLAGNNGVWGILKGPSIDWFHIPDSVLSNKRLCGKSNPIFINDSLIIISDYCSIYKYSKGKYELIHSSEGRIHFVDHTAEGDLLVASGSGAYILPLSDQKAKPRLFLENVSASHFFEDRYGNLWITTLGSGLFLVPLPALSIESILMEDESTASLTEINGTLLIGTTKNRILALKENKPDTIIDFKDRKGIINKIYEDHLGNLWVGSDVGAYVIDLEIIENRRDFDVKTRQVGHTSHISSVYNHFDLSSVNDFTSSRDSSVLIGSRFGLFKVKKHHGPGRGFTISTLLREQVSALIHKDSGKFLVGGLNGLSGYSLAKGLTSTEDIPLLKENISKLELDDEGIVWAATSSIGIYAFKDSILLHISQPDGLTGNNCIDLTVQGDTIWVATDNGLSRITLSRERPYKATFIRNLTKKDGLASGEIKALQLLDDTLFVGGTEGISAIALNTMEFPKSFPLKITNVKDKNGTSIMRSANSKIPFSANDFTMDFKGIRPACQGNLTYYYSLENHSENWVKTSSTEVKFSSLAPGQYVFGVYAVDCHNTKSNTETFSFTILPPWWQQTRFKVLLLLTIIFTIAGVIWSIRNYYKRKSDLRALVADLENQALRAQMNPHFIFNALNAVNEFITNRDKLEANTFLSKFSSLIRKTLQNSRKEEISLSEELESLSLYLDLEKMRFNDSFNYSFKIKETIDPHSTFVPPLLLQPFAENSIRHGLVHKQRDGLIQVKVSTVSDKLIIHIEDNGVGINSHSQKNKEHQSLGIELSRKRIVNFSNMKNTRAEGLEVRNINSTDNNGVLVTITLSYLTD